MPEAVAARVEDVARQAGLPLSSWAAYALEHEARIAGGLAAVREWEAEAGPFTEEELAWADAQVASADAQYQANTVEPTSSTILEYGEDMATKKITITLPEDALARVREFAKEVGMPLSTWLAKMVEHRIRILEGQAAMREWETKYGAFTEEELAEARAELARVDAELRAARAPITPGSAA